MVINPKVLVSGLYLIAQRRYKLDVASLLEKVKPQQTHYLVNGSSVRWEERADCHHEPFLWGLNDFSSMLHTSAGMRMEQKTNIKTQNKPADLTTQ